MILEPWPRPLVKDIARRRSVVVIGSGVSRHATGNDGVTKPPVWKQFLLEAGGKIGRADQTEHIFRAIEQGDLLHACEWLKLRYDEEWTRFLRSKFYEPRYCAGKLHELIAMLDSRIVFSLNFDDIYENKAREVNENSLFLKHYYDADVCEFLRGDDRYVVKVHGNLSSPATLIFTQQDYAQARVKYSLFYSAFDAALMTHSFVFIGCGYSDPDVNLLLENQAFRAYPDTGNPHYFVTSAEISDDLKQSLRKNRNLKTLAYDKVDERHSGLITAVDDLRQRVDEERAELGVNWNW